MIPGRLYDRSWHIRHNALTFTSAQLLVFFRTYPSGLVRSATGRPGRPYDAGAPTLAGGLRFGVALSAQVGQHG
jgi:hypothetical protein